jgi:hypothetical protein
MGNAYSYQPMTPQRVASEEEVQAMHAKLASKVRGKVSDGSGSVPKGIDAASPPANGGSVERPRLEWEKPTSKDATGLKTKCGRYSCAKVTLNGRVTYELWKLAPGGGWFRQFHKGLDDFAQVRKLAQLDADKGVA